MFNSTAYGAVYKTIGMAMHDRMVAFLSNEVIFKALITFIFGIVFFMLVAQILSRYMPDAFINRRFVSASSILKLLVLYAIGVSILNVSTHVDLKDFSRKSWSGNSYVEERVGELPKTGKMSFIFAAGFQGVEEIVWLLGRGLDWAISDGHSQLKNPNFFYKSILYAGSSTIEDPRLREKLDLYTDSCMLPLMPDIEGGAFTRVEVFFWGSKGPADLSQALEKRVLREDEGLRYTCLDLRDEVTQGLYQRSLPELSYMEQVGAKLGFNKTVDPEAFRNYEISSALLNYYKDGHESILGIQKGSQLPGPFGKAIQYIDKLISPEGVLRAIGLGNQAGAVVAADRAEEFNEQLKRAPHLMGFLQMVILGFSPFLLFFLVGGRVKPVIWVFVIYASIATWPVVWSFIYQIMMKISATSDVLATFGELKDLASMSAAMTVQDSAYYQYEVFTWIQLISGMAISGGFIAAFQPIMRDFSEDHTPRGVHNAAAAASTVSRGGV